MKPGGDDAPIDQRLLELDRVAIGRFRCPTHHPRFGNSGPIGGTLVVFPRTSVWIQHAGAEPILADATRAMLYNDGQEYRRAPSSPDGDRCEWFAYDPALVAEALAAHEPAARERSRRPFRAACAPVDARTYALQRGLFSYVARQGAAADPLYVEETALTLLGRVAGGLHPASAGKPPRPDTARAHAELALAVQERLSQRLGERLSLAQLARPLGCSPFHLARVFARATGRGIHAYRTQLRLRAALEQVADRRADLTAVALELGFSSHSHFTDAFVAAFGSSPSAFRRASKIPEAR